MKYQVWRYHVKQGEFTFQELKAWMLNHLPSYTHDSIRLAKRAVTKHYNIDGNHALNWIAANCEYCSIKRVK